MLISTSTREYGLFIGVVQILRPLDISRNTLRDAANAPGPQDNSRPEAIFSINGTIAQLVQSNTDRRFSSLTFRTDVAISNANTHRTLQSYPYDK